MVRYDRDGYSMSLLLRSMTTDVAREDEVLFVKYDLHAVSLPGR